MNGSDRRIHRAPPSGINRLIEGFSRSQVINSDIDKIMMITIKVIGVKNILRFFTGFGSTLDFTAGFNWEIRFLRDISMISKFSQLVIDNKNTSDGIGDSSRRVRTFQ